ncbi:conserved hypothetical protein [Candidatus Terasakiella magnetica]|nr:conserved hypothetical protein [Candidatus Terasakiella magnetica]
MTPATGEGGFLEAQQDLYEEMALAIDGLKDPLELLTQVQDDVGLLLKRDGDQGLRDRTLGEISHYFLGIIHATDLSSEYKLRKMRAFAKSAIKILVARRPLAAAEAAHSAPVSSMHRRGTDAS